MININIPMSNDDLISGMAKIIQHIKNIQAENRRLKQENQRLKAQVQAQVQMNTVVSFD